MMLKLFLHENWGRSKWWLLRLAITIALIPTFSGASYAQTGTFGSGSNGSDGALNLTTPGTIVFDPRSFNPPLDPDGDNIYHFTTINIAAGVTVKLSAKYLNGPVFWLASGAVQIDGIVDLNGEDGSDARNYTNNASRVPTVPGAGGYGGGIGALGASAAQPGSGPGGGRLQDGNGTGGGAAHATPFINSPAYGNDFLLPLIGGSGGAGGSFGGGGAGGGAILVASSASIAVNGAITANGGRNIAAGGGSGGSIRLVAPTISGSGALRVSGPITGSTFYGGSDGRIRLEAFQHTFTGSAAPFAIRSTPFALFLPQNPPSSVKVIGVAGAGVPGVPANSFTTPDVTINQTAAATINIEAHYVPLGTAVTLVLIPENGTDQVVNSTPLAGTFAQSTATASVTVPSGFSRMYVRATWTP